MRKGVRTNKRSTLPQHQPTHLLQPPDAMFVMSSTGHGEVGGEIDRSDKSNTHADGLSGSRGASMLSDGQPNITNGLSRPCGTTPSKRMSIAPPAVRGSRHVTWEDSDASGLLKDMSEHKVPPTVTVVVSLKLVPYSVILCSAPLLEHSVVAVEVAFSPSTASMISPHSGRNEVTSAGGTTQLRLLDAPSEFVVVPCGHLLQSAPEVSPNAMLYLPMPQRPSQPKSEVSPNLAE